MKDKNETQNLGELATRVQDLDRKVDHLLFMLAECRRLHRCDFCGRVSDENGLPDEIGHH
jgi:hypothetical protein